MKPAGLGRGGWAVVVAVSAMLCAGACSPDEIAAPPATTPATTPAATSSATPTEQKTAGAADNAGTRSPSVPPVRPSAKPAPGPNASCDLLTRAEVTKLAGRRLPGPNSAEFGGLAVCQWGTQATGGVQVVGVPAGAWVRQLPAAVAQLKASGPVDSELARKLEDASDLIEAGNEIEPGRACELFSALLEFQGQPSGTDSVVNLFPSRENVHSINGQACSGGKFTSVQLVGPELSGSDAEVAKVSNALASARRRNAG